MHSALSLFTVPSIFVEQEHSGSLLGLDISVVGQRRVRDKEELSGLGSWTATSAPASVPTSPTMFHANIDPFELASVGSDRRSSTGAGGTRRESSVGRECEAEVLERMAHSQWASMLDEAGDEVES